MVATRVGLFVLNSLRPPRWFRFVLILSLARLAIRHPMLGPVLYVSPIEGACKWSFLVVCFRTLVSPEQPPYRCRALDGVLARAFPPSCFCFIPSFCLLFYLLAQGQKASPPPSSICCQFLGLAFVVSSPPFFMARNQFSLAARYCA